ncbi:CASP-like protein [Actinidia chinensis var. chinensis]|uniref:CASP-like protein n=1 Tax=Actinidia chinensis var. chinensis TaxID=1590841 RepID=A0A2R6PJY6_ACTCC|nr:CASP-like protein [Actinidia chinensis var. chinensis]
MDTLNYNGGTMEGGKREKEVTGGGGGGVRCSEFGMRVLAFALTLVAAIVLGVDKQTKVVPVPVVSTLPPLNVPVTAKWHYLSAFVYFVVANSIACTYAALSLVLTLANRGGKKGLALIITILDIMMVALLFSGEGAAAAVGIIGYKGNSHVRWNKVCNVFEEFCHQVAAALVLSLLGSVAFFLLVVLAALNLHKKCK